MRFHGFRHAATLALVAAFAASPAAAKTISVTAGTPDANEKLQEALILAEPRPTPAEILPRVKPSQPSIQVPSPFLPGMGPSW